MQPKTVCVKLVRKANLGNYEGIECEVFFSAEIEEGEDFAGCAEFLGFQAKEAIASVLEKETPSMPFVKVKKTFRGKEVINNNQPPF